MFHRNFGAMGFLAAAFLLLFYLHSASAQTAAASIRGVVKDQQGAAVAEASVTATRIETGTVATTKTNTEGTYSFTGLTPGHFRISVTKQGFKEVSTNDFVLGVSDRGAAECDAAGGFGNRDSPGHSSRG